MCVEGDESSKLQEHIIHSLLELQRTHMNVDYG